MTIAPTAIPPTNDDAYRDLLQNVQRRFIASVTNNAPLFTTDIPDLYTQFLKALPVSEQQYNCSACRQFVNRFGGLVVIDAAGVAQPALWHLDDTPASYQAAIAALHQAIKRAKVTGVFYSSLPVWGKPVTGSWEHFALTPPAALVFRRVPQTAAQASAANCPG